MFLVQLENTLLGFCSKERLNRQIVATIVEAYSEGHRHYHNWEHLEFVFAEMLELKDEISDWDAMVFAIAFHDVVYDPARNDNEERSAERAVKILQTVQVPDASIQLVNKIILASKSHPYSDLDDVNYFCDADLEILGADEIRYKKYLSDIRKEYSIFSDSEFNRGRKRVLEHFLNMQRIFKTEFFNRKYESQARVNLHSELSSL